MRQAIRANIPDKNIQIYLAEVSPTENAEQLKQDLQAIQQQIEGMQKVIVSDQAMIRDNLAKLIENIQLDLSASGNYYFACALEVNDDQGKKYLVTLALGDAQVQLDDKVIANASYDDDGESYSLNKAATSVFNWNVTEVGETKPEIVMSPEVEDDQLEIKDITIKSSVVDVPPQVSQQEHESELRRRKRAPEDTTKSAATNGSGKGAPRASISLPPNGPKKSIIGKVVAATAGLTGVSAITFSVMAACKVALIVGKFAALGAAAAFLVANWPWVLAAGVVLAAGSAAYFGLFRCGRGDTELSHDAHETAGLLDRKKHDGDGASTDLFDDDEDYTSAAFGAGT